MLLLIRSAVALFACRDIERPADHRQGSMLVREQEGPPVVLAVTCRLDGASKRVSCSLPLTAPSWAHAPAQYGLRPAMRRSIPINLVKDPVAQTWQFTAYLQNLLKDRSAQ